MSFFDTCLRWFLSLMILVSSISTALALDKPTKRIALIIGNNDYVSSPLKNAVNDAEAMADKLKEIGFDVSLQLNANQSTLKKSVKEFYNKVTSTSDQKTLALFYYAGHAVQINHRNYLVPLGFKKNKHEFINSLFDINLLFDNIPRSIDISNIIILDACRDNPLGPHIEISGDGLAPLRAPSATLIAYATEPGNVADDGKGINGVYTEHLLKYIGEKIPVEEVFRKVRKDVARVTKKRQIPWEHSSLIEEVFFNMPLNRDMPDLLTF